MTLTWETKDPDEVKDYQVDWSATLDEGDTIGSSNITWLSGTVVIDSQAKTDTASTCWLSGGTVGETSVFQARITTAGGRTFEQTIVLPVVSSAATDLVITGHVAPSPQNLMDMYPAFTAVSRGAIQSRLTLAGRSVDTSWEEGDYPFAIMALAAHLLETDGFGTGAAAQAAAAGAGEFKSMKSGALSLERFDMKAASGGAHASPYQATRYGREYLRLLRLNKGGPLTTGTAGLPGPDVWPC